VKILDLKFSPSLTSGVGLIQLLSWDNVIVIRQSKKSNQNGRKQVISYLINETEPSRRFDVLTSPNAPDSHLVTQISDEIVPSGPSHLWIYGEFHAIFQNHNLAVGRQKEQRTGHHFNLCGWPKASEPHGQTCHQSRIVV
jgi:hypothetical protein